MDPQTHTATPLTFSDAWEAGYRNIEALAQTRQAQAARDNDAEYLLLHERGKLVKLAVRLDGRLLQAYLYGLHWALTEHFE